MHACAHNAAIRAGITAAAVTADPCQHLSPNHAILSAVITGTVVDATDVVIVDVTAVVVDCLRPVHLCFASAGGGAV
jgi:hypothetical protein